MKMLRDHRIGACNFNNDSDNETNGCITNNMTSGRRCFKSMFVNPKADTSQEIR